MRWLVPAGFNSKLLMWRLFYILEVCSPASLGLWAAARALAVVVVVGGSVVVVVVVVCVVVVGSGVVVVGSSVVVVGSGVVVASFRPEGRLEMKAGHDVGRGQAPR